MVSHPAKGCPDCSAVNLATDDDVLMPDTSGFAIICNCGFVSFSKVVQFQVAPKPDGSKSIGAF